MIIIAALLALVGCEEGNTIPLTPSGGYFHFQPFSDDSWKNSWEVSSLPSVSGKWKVETTGPPQGIPGQKMNFMQTEKSYYGLSTAFSTPFDPDGKTIVVQYEVRLQDTLECGGAYIKLFHKDNFVPASLSNQSRYIIMFGPDKCGSTNKVHFIFRHRNPKTGVYEEKHMTETNAIKSDKITHLYTLIVRPDNSFEILIDAESVRQGDLLKDFAPSVNPPKEIDDPTDVKPADWVDDEKIDDPSARKPDDWDESQPEYIKDPEKLEPPPGWLLDEPKFVPDAAAQAPEDWDEVIHGPWEPPTVANPKCDTAPGCGPYDPPLIKNSAFKGKWRPPKIPNPAYKGRWRARQIRNPDYFEDKTPSKFEPIIGAGFELWSIQKNLGFGNVFLGHNEEAVHKWNKEHFVPKFKIESEEKSKSEPTPGPKSARTGEGFLSALREFGTQLKDAWNELYEENPVATVTMAVAVVAVPLLLAFLCCRRRPAKTQVAAPKPAEEPDVAAGEREESEVEKRTPKETSDE
jgi:calnexin